jgi:hypothetical protein
LRKGVADIAVDTALIPEMMDDISDLRDQFLKWSRERGGGTAIEGRYWALDRWLEAATSYCESVAGEPPTIATYEPEPSGSERSLSVIHSASPSPLTSPIPTVQVSSTGLESATSLPALRRSPSPPRSSPHSRTPSAPPQVPSPALGKGDPPPSQHDYLNLWRYSTTMSADPARASPTSLGLGDQSSSFLTSPWSATPTPTSQLSPRSLTSSFQPPSPYSDPPQRSRSPISPPSRASSPGLPPQDDAGGSELDGSSLQAAAPNHIPPPVARRIAPVPVLRGPLHRLEHPKPGVIPGLHGVEYLRLGTPSAKFRGCMIGGEAYGLENPNPQTLANDPSFRLKAGVDDFMAAIAVCHTLTSPASPTSRAQGPSWEWDFGPVEFASHFGYEFMKREPGTQDVVVGTLMGQSTYECLAILDEPRGRGDTRFSCIYRCPDGIIRCFSKTHQVFPKAVEADVHFETIALFVHQRLAESVVVPTFISVGEVSEDDFWVWKERFLNATHRRDIRSAIRHMESDLRLVGVILTEHMLGDEAAEKLRSLEDASVRTLWVLSEHQKALTVRLSMDYGVFHLDNDDKMIKCVTIDEKNGFLPDESLAGKLQAKFEGVDIKDYEELGLIIQGEILRYACLHMGRIGSSLMMLAAKARCAVLFDLSADDAAWLAKLIDRERKHGGTTKGKKEWTGEERRDTPTPSYRPYRYEDEGSDEDPSQDGDGDSVHRGPRRGGRPPGGTLNWFKRRLGRN